MAQSPTLLLITANPTVTLAIFRLCHDNVSLRKEETLLVFTVLAVVVLSTFAGVAMGGARFANAGGNMLTGVELTSIHTLLTEETWTEKSKE